MIKFRTDKQGACSADIGALAPVFEKSATELKLRPDPKLLGGCYHGVMVKAMDFEIVVSEFELQLHYYVHFRTNNLQRLICH